MTDITKPEDGSLSVGSIAIGVMMAVIAIATILLGVHVQRAYTPASSEAYRDVATADRVCPAMRGEIREAISHGKLTEAQVDSIANDMRADMKTYSDAVTLNETRVYLKLPPMPLPEICSDTDNEGADAPFYDYGTK